MMFERVCIKQGRSRPPFTKKIVSASLGVDQHMNSCTQTLFRTDRVTNVPLSFKLHGVCAKVQ